MSIREFRCIDCGYIAETVCPECNGRKPEVLFSVFGVSGSEKRVASSSKCTSCMTRNRGTCA